MINYAHLESPNDPGFICKPELSVSGLASGELLLDEILSVSEGYIKRDSILKISLTKSYLSSNDSYPFNSQELYNIISSTLTHPFYVEKLEEVGDVTVLYLYGKTTDLEKMFGTLEAKSLSEIYLEVSGELQLANVQTCTLTSQTPEIQGITTNSASFDTKETSANFLKVKVRYKKAGTSNWSYVESSNTGVVEIAGLESGKSYIASYMKYCSLSDYSFYSEPVLFKTF